MPDDTPKCELCGEPMPAGEEMFNYHGYSGPCPKPPLPKIRSGIEMIAAERQRHIDVEGFTPEHDDAHENGEMIAAAECYVALAFDQIAINPKQAKRCSTRVFDMVPMQWPWEPQWWKPSPDPIKNMKRAAALLAAEIDRLHRIPKNETRDRLFKEAVKRDEINNAKRILREAGETLD